jgi:SAM-dependent methyltransferase
VGVCGAGMTGGGDKRAVARELAARALSDGEPLRWFEELYSRGETAVPWADLQPNPVLVRELDALAVAGLRTLVVGCGYGDDAAFVAESGAVVTAFDIAPSAVERAQERFPDLGITWAVRDATAPPSEWVHAFDLVVEIFTLQVLPIAEREIAARALGSCVAPGGRLFVYCRGRDDDDPEGTMPWPLTPDELLELDVDGLQVERFEDFLDDEDPPVRRFLVVLRSDR